MGGMLLHPLDGVVHADVVDGFEECAVAVEEVVAEDRSSAGSGAQPGAEVADERPVAARADARAASGGSTSGGSTSGGSR